MKIYKDLREDLLTPEEVCAILRIKKQRLYEWVHYSKVPYIKVGRFLRFSRSRLLSWIESNSYDIIGSDGIREK
jgi:excisionase family DNA binding protein